MVWKLDALTLSSQNGRLGVIGKLSTQVLNLGTFGAQCSSQCIGFPGGSEVKASASKRPGFHPWVGKILWRRAWQPVPVFLPGESQGQRNLVSYSPWGRKELDMTERLGTHTNETAVKSEYRKKIVIPLKFLVCLQTWDPYRKKIIIK